MNGIGIFRALVYYKRDFFKADKSFWLIGFCTFYVSCYILLFTAFGMEPSPINLFIEFLPIIGMTLTNISYKLKSAKKIRLFALFNSIPWGSYHLYNASIGGTIGEAFNLVSSFIGIIRHDIKKRKEPETSTEDDK